MFYFYLVVVGCSSLIVQIQASCGGGSGRLRTNIPHTPCAVHSDCDLFGANVKCLDTGSVDGPLCLHCKCNQTSECEVMQKANGQYKVVGCNCEQGSYGDLCNCRECNCSAPHPGCEEGWKHHDDSCYRMFGADLNFVDAMLACNQSQATLVMLESHEENHFISDSYIDVSGTAWIGLWMIAAGGEFEWISGDPLGPDANFGDVGDGLCVYINIDASLPDDNGKWYRDDCSQLHNYICEKPVGELMV